MKKKIIIATALIISLLLSIAVSFSQIPAQKNAIYYNEKGREYLAKSDYYRAILSFRNALKQNPKYKEAMYGLAKTYLKTEAYDESLNLFSDVLKIDKNNINAIIDSAYALGKIGQYNNALKYLDKALAMDEGNIEARYNLAYIYFLMDKIIWSKRKLNDIFMINPYHYQSLLLYADIKTREHREKEALDYIQKAIDADQENPEAYVKYGLIMLRKFRNTQDQDDMVDAVEKFNRALAVNPENLQANRSLGLLFLVRKDYARALEYFKKNNSDYPGNPITLYNMALAYEGLNDSEYTVSTLLKSLEIKPSDSILIAKLEDYLALKDFAAGHPLRVKFSEDNLKSANASIKNNLADSGILFTGRSLFMNPLNRQARESLREIYLIMDYYRLYLNEQKTLFELYPEKKYQDQLSIDVIKRRDRLYYKAGYYDEMPVRDVPEILALDFTCQDPVSLHPDSGTLIGNYMTFALSQLGRMKCVPIQKRLEITGQLKNDRQFLGDDIEVLSDMIRDGKINEPDYLLFGTYTEGINYINAGFELMDFKNGVIIDDFTLSENGKEDLPNLSVRAARKIYDMIPFKGRILKIENNEIIINLGLIDGIKKGDYVSIFKLDTEVNEKLNLKKKITLEITGADTYISSAKNKIQSEISALDINDTVYPYKKRRAKLIK